MKQLTLRGFGPEVERALRRLAREDGISLNKAALRLLRRGAGLDDVEGDAHLIGDGLDRFIGTWTGEEARAFDQAVADFDRIDDGLWS